MIEEIAMLVKALAQRARQFNVILDQQNTHCRLVCTIE
jgi:hypothetical protein